MTKNKLQTACGQEMIQLLEQISLENREAIDLNIPAAVLSKASLSKGAQRNFDRLMQVFQLTKCGPRKDFVAELDAKL